MWMVMFALTGAVLFAAAEITLRVVLNRALTAAEAGSPLVQSDVPEMGYELARNQHDGPVRTDADGFRVVANATPKEGRSILLIGDSVAYGMGVRYEHTLAPALETHLEQQVAVPVVVRNASVPGYNTSQEAARLRQVGRSVKPDVIVVQVCLNDHLDAPSLTETGVLDASGAQASGGFSLVGLAYSSRTLVLVKDKIRDAQQLYPEWFPTWSHYIRYVHQKPGWERAKTALLDIADTAKRLDARLLVVLFPMEQQLRIGDRNAQESLLGFMRQHNLPALDLYEPFRARWREQLYVNYWSNVGAADKLHLSERGHDLAAREIAAALASQAAVYFPATVAP
jgi:lysophospholipase L1-like esterase